MLIAAGNTKAVSWVSSRKKRVAKVKDLHVWKQFKLRYKEKCSEPRSWRAMGTSLPVFVMPSVVG